jgi:hypothetical protein
MKSIRLLATEITERTEKSTCRHACPLTKWRTIEYSTVMGFSSVFSVSSVAELWLLA